MTRATTWMAPENVLLKGKKPDMRGRVLHEPIYTMHQNRRAPTENAGQQFLSNFTGRRCKRPLTGRRERMRLQASQPP